VENAGEQPKRPRTDSEPAMSGGLPLEDASTEIATEPATEEATTDKAVEAPVPAEEKPAETVAEAAEAETAEAPAEPSAEPTNDGSPLLQPPAARIRMTVTSGFYVRSLCHDLGLACSSLGIMSALIRSRQGDYTLDDNVVEFSDLEKGLEVWEPKIRKQLEDFMEKEGWEAEELEDDEAWEEKKSELMKRRKENDRDTSYKGGNKGKGNWKGKGGGNYYSKNMNGGNR
jgi:tRNA pseudouridine55 synthase